jgi:hypothetical protein
MTFTKIDSVRGVYRMKAVPVVVEAESAEN